MAEGFNLPLYLKLKSIHVLKPKRLRKIYKNKYKPFVKLIPVNAKLQSNILIRATFESVIFSAN